MELTITRHDTEIFSLNAGYSTRPGLKASELKEWLLNLGADESAIDEVLKVAPRKSINVYVPDRAA
jgi:hypothetical protein